MEAVSAPEYAAALQTLAPAVMELREKLNPERAGIVRERAGIKQVFVVVVEKPADGRFAGLAH